MSTKKKATGGKGQPRDRITVRTVDAMKVAPSQRAFGGPSDRTGAKATRRSERPGQRVLLKRIDGAIVRVLPDEVPPTYFNGALRLDFDIGDRVIAAAKEFTPAELAESLKDFIGKFDTVLQGLPALSSGFAMDEVEVSLAINGKGGFELVAKGEIGFETGLKVTFRRKSQRSRKPVAKQTAGG